MQFSWMIIPSERTGTLRRSMQRTGTWAEFVADVGPHTAGDKGGRAVVPYLADWTDGLDEQPRSGAQDRPGARWSVISLDLDHCTEDQLDDARATLDEARVLYLEHSTYSYVPEERTKARIHIALGTALTRDEVPVAKDRVAHWLGLDADKATRGGYTLFYTPRCPEELLEHAYIIARVAAPHGPLWVETMTPELGEEETTDGRPRGLLAPKRNLTQVLPRLADEWPEEVRDAAQRQLDRLVDMLTSHREQHVRERLKAGVSLLGGYSAAGLIEQKHVHEKLVEAITVRHANGYDDHSLQYRLDQLAQFMTWGGERPILPDGFDENGYLAELEKAKASGDAMTRLRAQLLAQTPETMSTAAEAGQELFEFLRDKPNGLDRYLGLVEVSVGVGKTYALRQLAAERAARGEYTIILSLDHALLGQIRRDLIADLGEGAVRHMHSLQQATEKTGGPQCLIAGRMDVRAKLANGLSLAGSVCPSCEHKLKDTCPAIKHNKRKLESYIILAPYQLARRARDLAMDAGAISPLIVSDEEPPPPVTTWVSEESFKECLADNYVWELLRSDQRRLVMAFMEALIDGSHEDMPVEAIEELASYHGQLHAPNLALIDIERCSGLLESIKACLTLANGWDTLRKVGDDWFADVPNGAWQVLAEDGGFILSATPNYALYENFPLTVQPLVLRVKDAQPASRTVFYTKHATRKEVLEDGEVNWELVEADLKELWRVTQPNERILIGTYKAISDALRTTHKHLLVGRQCATIHYEVVRGRDDWREWEVFCSLYDPRIPADTLAAGTDSAARSLEQFHGRARDPQRRAVSATHIHFGTVAPRTWWLDDGKGHGDGRAQIRVRVAGRPPNPLDNDAMLVLRAYIEWAGGRRAAWEKTDISAATMSRWLAGKGAPNPIVLGMMRKELARTGWEQ